jgi:hypothetical protein
MTQAWLTLLAAAALLAPITPAKKPAAPRWHVSGMFTEACTCSPPCTCNFGLGASPHDFCYSIFSYGIKKGEYNGVPLDGLNITCANGQRGYVWYVDQRATPAQRAALRAIAARIAPLGPETADSPHHHSWQMIPAAITQEVTEHGSRLQIEGAGGFDSTFLMGGDGKTPVVVLNNTSFNLKRSVKGKTITLRYKDRFGNDLDFKGTNSNTGEFDYNQDTKRFRG